jgi:hypothetical protein
MTKFVSFKRLLRVVLVFHLLSFSFFYQGYAQRAEGYYVTNSGDTIACEIKRNKEPHLGLKEVVVIDSADSEISFTPSQIKCFSYTLKNSDHLFCPKSTLDSTVLFIEAIANGKNTNVFYYDIEDLVRPKGNPAGPFVRKEQSYIQIYLFEIKGRGTYFLSVNSIAHGNDLETIKSKLKYFYGGKREIMEMISDRFQKRTEIRNDIKSLADATNEM